MCHLSHSYHGGACLYFTFAFRPTPGGDMLAGVRRREAGDPAGVRRQRRARCRTTTRSAPSTPRWLEQDITAPGVRMLEALFDGTDPGSNLNPGKIV